MLAHGESPPIYKNLKTGKVTTSTTPTAFPAGYGGLIRIYNSDTTNAIYYGPTGTTAADGMLLPPGGERFLFIEDLASLVIFSAAGTPVVTWENWK